MAYDIDRDCFEMDKQRERSEDNMIDAICDRLEEDYLDQEYELDQEESWGN